jgi:hypothetical protein
LAVRYQAQFRDRQRRGGPGREHQRRRAGGFRRDVVRAVRLFGSRRGARAGYSAGVR